MEEAAPEDEEQSKHEEEEKPLEDNKSVTK